MEKIKVMHIIDSLRVGGAENVVSTMVDLLDKNRFDVSVCYFSDGDIAGILREKKITLDKVPLTKFLLPLFLFRLVRLMRRKRVDIVHTHLFTADVLGRVAARLAGVKAVFCTLHTSYRYKTKTDPVNRLKLLIDSVTGNCLCNKFVAVSAGIKDYHLKTQGIAPEKIHVLANPVRIRELSVESTFDPLLKKAEIGLNPDSLVVFNAANLTQVKGQQYLISAMEKIAHVCPRAVLMIAGEGPLRPALTSMIHDLGLDGRIHLLGRRNDVIELLAITDVFVLSSLNEGVSIALLEAMGEGKPIVATRVGGNAEVIQDGNNGLLVQSKDSDALARGVIELLNNRTRAEALAIEAQKAAKERYDATTIMAEMEELYVKSVVNSIY